MHYGTYAVADGSSCRKTSALTSSLLYPITPRSSDPNDPGGVSRWIPILTTGPDPSRAFYHSAFPDRKEFSICRRTVFIGSGSSKSSQNDVPKPSSLENIPVSTPMGSIETTHVSIQTVNGGGDELITVSSATPSWLNDGNSHLLSDAPQPEQFTHTESPATSHTKTRGSPVTRVNKPEVRPIALRPITQSVVMTVVSTSFIDIPVTKGPKATSGIPPPSTGEVQRESPTGNNEATRERQQPEPVLPPPGSKFVIMTIISTSFVDLPALKATGHSELPALNEVQTGNESANIHATTSSSSVSNRDVGLIISSIINDNLGQSVAIALPAPASPITQDQGTTPAEEVGISQLVTVASRLFFEESDIHPTAYTHPSGVVVTGSAFGSRTLYAGHQITATINGTPTPISASKDAEGSIVLLLPTPNSSPEVTFPRSSTAPLDIRTTTFTSGTTHITGYLIGSQTLYQNHPITLTLNNSTTPISMSIDMNNTTVLVVGTSTINLSPPFTKVVDAEVATHEMTRSPIVITFLSTSTLPLTTPSLEGKPKVPSRTSSDVLSSETASKKSKSGRLVMDHKVWIGFCLAFGVTIHGFI